MADFVLIKERRIRKTTIKEYAPVENNKLVVYFSVSRYKIEKEVYKFETEKERKDILEVLDSTFLKKL